MSELDELIAERDKLVAEFRELSIKSRRLRDRLLFIISKIRLIEAGEK